MAAYGALVSLMHTIEQTKQHPLPPFSLDPNHFESLINIISFLQHFLEDYPQRSSKEGIEPRIADAAYAVEDIIESAEARSGSTSHGEEISSTDFNQRLNRAKENIEMVMKVAMEIKEQTGVNEYIRRDSSSPAGSSRASITMGLDGVSEDLLDKLTGQQSGRRIIAVAGMGGIGKTTLARKIYFNQLIMEQFDISVWVTVSIEYDLNEFFLEILRHGWRRDELSRTSEDELGLKMFQMLYGRRYLIVLDDVWSIEVWEKASLFFPNNNNGSRILITTRLMNVAFQLTDVSSVLKMNFLDAETSWNLFCNIVFGDGNCPLEMEDVGKEIARNCRGLPLSIVVIGGLLARSEKTREYWGYIAENLSSVVNLEDDERCLSILHTSYTQLPVYLKPCFLYMGIYPQQHAIRVSLLVKLWVGEGFLKPVRGKSLEVVAEEYLQDLIGRNLIIVCKLASDGRIKFCKIHDLLRDMCLRESPSYCATRSTPQGLNTRRCIGIRCSALKEDNFSHFVSLYRLAIVDAPAAPQSGRLALLRTMRAVDKHSYAIGEMENLLHSLEDVFQLVNLRFLAVRPNLGIYSVFPSSVYLLRNLQTLIVHSSNLIAPYVIWMMPQLRHVMFGVLDLPHPREGQEDIVLENLQTLSRVNNFKCSDEVVKRILNVKKLKVYYESFEGISPGFYLHNLSRLHHLESLSCSFTSGDTRSYLLRNVNFPHSLKKLTLEATFLHWEDMAEMIGPLPHLQVLKLRFCAFTGPEWETVEDQFCCLRFLLIDTCLDFQSWITESSHFPCLERLVLRDLEKLEAIPSSIGDILTLESIEIDRCGDAAVVSARELLDEQEGFGNGGLQVRVKLWKRNEGLESLASPNFKVSR